MIIYVARRLGLAVLLALLVLTLIFLLIRAVPGDPATVLASGGGTGGSSEITVQQVRERLGLDRPLGRQYLDYLGGAVHGDLGSSFVSDEPVRQTVQQRLPNTLKLILGATIIGVGFGLLLGALAARRGGAVDALVTGFTSLTISLPVYVLGVVAIYTVALGLRWLPSGGPPDWNDPVDQLRSLILPSVSLGIPLIGIVARMTRASILETQRQDWVRTGVSWGLSPTAVFFKHILRNALTPVTTAVGLQIGIMLGSTVLVEGVFAYPGMSSQLIDAITDRDYPVVQGIVIIIAVMFILLNVLVDVLYGVLDPRVRH